MPLGPFDPIPPREKVMRSHINDLRTALTGIQDAYDVAVANGFTGTRGQWLDSLKGEKGDPGPGVPDGGATGQVLAKTGAADQATGWGQVGTTGIAPQAVTPQETSFVAPGKNLYDRSAATAGYVVAFSGGGLSASAGYETSDYIPVKANQAYTYSSANGVGGARYIGYYDAAKTFVSRSDLTNNTGPDTETPEQDGYVRVSFLSSQAATAQVEAGDAATAYAAYRLLLPAARMGNDNLEPQAVTETAIAPQAVTADKTDFYRPGKNLFDPDAITPDIYINETTGAEQAFAGYITTDYIPVVAGQSYTITQARKIILYNAERSFLAGTNESQATGPKTVTPEQDGYLRVSLDTNHASYTPQVRQIEAGDDATAYEPFARTIPGLSFTEAQRVAITGATPLDRPVSVSVSGDAYTITNDLGGAALAIATERYGSHNGTFSFEGTTLDGVTIHSTGDDITPIRTFTTVGANHGYTCIASYTVAGHGKTSADLGSQWTDGVRTYTLLRIDGDDLIFGGPYTTDAGGVVTGDSTDPEATLTHVSGATNTTSVPITTTGGTTQLYPSVKAVSVRYELDGAEITADGTYGGDVLRVIESYEILDYGALIDWARANVGQAFAANVASIDGVVRIANVYTFTGQGRCMVSASLTALKPVTLANTGFLQSVALAGTAGTVSRAMPRVAAKSGYDFAAPVDMTSYATSITFGPADYLDPTKPPAWYVDWIESGGQKLIGFAMGYIIDKTNSKDSDRAALSASWNLRDTKKSYPYALGGVTLAAGEHRSVEGFRCYLAPPENGATAVAVVEDTQAAYAYLLWHSPATAEAVPLPDHIGRGVTVLDSDGLTVANDTVDASGLTVTVPDSAGHAAVKLT